MYSNRAKHTPGLRAARLAIVAALGLLAVLVLILLSSAPSVHGQEMNTPSVSFSPGTIADQTYTAGARVDRLSLPVADLSNAAEDTFQYLVSYSITGLPGGLSMGNGALGQGLIHGIPERTTNGQRWVTYTATITVYVDADDDGSRDTDSENNPITSTYTNSLTFRVTVNPKVSFSDEARSFIYTGVIEWDNGSWSPAGSDGTVTFPAAQGGTGTLTYSLIDNDSVQPLASVASGITFDPATRKLGGTPAAAAQKDWPVRYLAEDTKGGRAFITTTIYAGGWEPPVGGL